MEKHRIIIADAERDYMIHMQAKMAELLVQADPDAVELEIITDRAYFERLLSAPQKADILIVSEDMYSPDIRRHNINSVFVLAEKAELSASDDNMHFLSKYTSLKEIFAVIVSKCPETFAGLAGSKESQLIVVSSACGGAGKTTVAMGICACLSQSGRKVLYINGENLHLFHYRLKNREPIPANEFYFRLANADSGIYTDIRHVIRKELFSYLPPFKAPLMSLGLSTSVFRQIAVSAKHSGDYDYIVLDTDNVFDEEKAALLDAVDKVLILTRQDEQSIFATNILASSINDIGSGKYIFICSDFDGESRYNALAYPDVRKLFTVSEHIAHRDMCEKLDAEELVSIAGMKETTYLIQ